jgi:hypothetical protein
MGLFALAVPGIERWSERDRKRLFDLCRLKRGGLEADYARSFRGNRRFFEALASVTGDGQPQ